MHLFSFFLWRLLVIQHINYLVSLSLLYIFKHLSEHCICPSLRYLLIIDCRAYFLICPLQYSHIVHKHGDKEASWYASHDNQYLPLDDSFDSFFSLSVSCTLFDYAVWLCAEQMIYSHWLCMLKAVLNYPRTLLTRSFLHTIADGLGTGPTLPPPSDITNLPHYTLVFKAQ